MNVRKTLDDIKAKLSHLSPENRVTGLVLCGIDKDAAGDIVIVSKSYIPFGDAGGEAWHEDYPPGDPRRVKWESAQ